MPFDADDDPGSSIHVSNMDEKVTEDLLNELFSQAGPVRSVKIPTDGVTGKRKGFAFVNFQESVTADYAIQLFKDTAMFSKVLNVRFSHKSACGGPSTTSTPFRAAHVQLNELQQNIINAAGAERRAALVSMHSPSLMGAYAARVSTQTQGIPYRHAPKQDGVATPSLLSRSFSSTPSPSHVSYPRQSSDPAQLMRQGYELNPPREAPAMNRIYSRQPSDTSSGQRDAYYGNGRRDSSEVRGDHRREPGDYQGDYRRPDEYRQPQSSAAYSSRSYDRSSQYPTSSSYQDRDAGHRPDGTGPTRSHQLAPEHQAPGRYHPYGRPPHNVANPSTYQQYARR